ncbi:uncharacterized protein [Emydura macquarii macquarii]|uniref:uncharacterized protein n=1 Tax=Emydura macquarii macquarii TaxID=1129001 RepID=UPI00352AF7FB
MRSILLHLGFLVTILQHLACPAEPCGDNSITQLQAKVGENVSMRCLFTVPNPLTAPKIQWNYIQANDKINLYKNSNWTESDLRYGSRFKARTWVNATGLAHGDATLHLAEVTPSDQGNYFCWVGLSYDCVSVEVQLCVGGKYKGGARRHVVGGEASGPPGHSGSASGGQRTAELKPPPKDLDCGLTAACFPGLVLFLAAAVTLRV